MTHFWAAIYKSIIGGSEKFSDLPKVTYAEMNRIEVAFATVKDSQVFRAVIMPGLIDEGYLFVDEAANEFWRKAGSPTSNPSGSASVSAGMDRNESAALGRGRCRRARGRQDQWGRHARSRPERCYWG